MKKMRGRGIKAIRPSEEARIWTLESAEVVITPCNDIIRYGKKKNDRQMEKVSI
jgi:hypothetical protein